MNAPHRGALRSLAPAGLSMEHLLRRTLAPGGSPPKCLDASEFARLIAADTARLTRLVQRIARVDGLTQMRKRDPENGSGETE